MVHSNITFYFPVNPVMHEVCSVNVCNPHEFHIKSVSDCLDWVGLCVRARSRTRVCVLGWGVGGGGGC